MYDLAWGFTPVDHVYAVYRSRGGGFNSLTRKPTLGLNLFVYIVPEKGEKLHLSQRSRCRYTHHTAYT